MSTGRTALYRLFDYREPAALLYVGISSCPRERIATHRRQKDWAPEIGVVEIEWFVSREEARAAEIAAICGELPTFNIADRLPMEAEDALLVAERQAAGATA